MPKPWPKTPNFDSHPYASCTYRQNSEPFIAEALNRQTKPEHWPSAWPENVAMRLQDGWKASRKLPGPLPAADLEQAVCVPGAPVCIYISSWFLAAALIRGCKDFINLPNSYPIRRISNNSIRIPSLGFLSRACPRNILVSIMLAHLAIFEHERQRINE